MSVQIFYQYFMFGAAQYLIISDKRQIFKKTENLINDGTIYITELRHTDNEI